MTWMSISCHYGAQVLWTEGDRRALRTARPDAEAAAAGWASGAYPAARDGEHPGAVGLATALRLAYQDLGAESGRIGALRARLENGIQSRLDQVMLNGHPQQRVSNIANLSFAFVEGEALLLALDTRGIAVSTASACSAGSTEPSHVLTAIGVDPLLAEGAIRFSLGRTNTGAEIDYVIDSVAEAVTRLRELSPLGGARTAC